MEKLKIAKRVLNATLLNRDYWAFIGLIWTLAILLQSAAAPIFFY